MYQVIVCGCLDNNNNNEKLGIGLELNVEEKKVHTMAWSFSSDMEHFKNTTIGHVVFMGHNTWLSIPNKFRPLKNRINIILTSKNIESTDKDIYYVNSIETGYQLYLDLIKISENQYKDLFVMGGETVYTQIIEIYPEKIDKLYLTTVYEPYPSNKYFPIEKYLKIKNKKIYQTEDKVDFNRLSKNKENIKYNITVYKFNYLSD